MKIICAICKYEYFEKTERKCPRCGTPTPIKGGCDNCKGCSLWNSCKVKQNTGSKNIEAITQEESR